MIKILSFSFLFLSLSVVSVKAARAAEDLSDAEEASSQKMAPPVLKLNPEDAFTRTQAVLSNFGVPAEADSQPLLASFQNLQTSQGVQDLLPYFDMKNEFTQFAQISSTALNAFQDASGFQVPDFSATFRDDSTVLPENPLYARLRAAQNNPDDQPLQGLRIALDPGHMGSDNWDQITGKWVHDVATGRKLSEGVLNLQTAMLLETQLTQLGATVMITHRTLAPVSQQDYAAFDVHAEGLDRLREQSMLPWFQALIAQASDGPALFNLFSASKDFQHLFAEINRGTYYNDSDLQARVDVIAAFQPDLTMMIHYDTSAPAPDQHALDPGPAGHRDGSKVYIPGAFDSTEMASRTDRVEFAKMVLDDSPWKASHAFAHEVVNTLSTNLGIPLEKNSPGITTQVEPGVFSRNLYLLKKYRNSAVAYVECLFYNDRGEFNQIYNATHPMKIGGESHPYSDRVAQVADSLKQGIVQFVKKGPN
jgi:N-acetylmuramoyl-L-alanine amidase